MLNNFKRRALTLLLSVAMIVTYIPMSTIAYAVDGNDQPAAAEEVLVEAEPAAEVVTEPAEEVAAEPAVVKTAEEPEEAAEEVVEAGPEEAEAEAAEEAEEAAPDEAAPAEEKAAEEQASPADEAAEAKAEAAEAAPKAEEKKPVDYSKELDTVAVKVTAPADAFNEKVELVVRQLEEGKKEFKEAEKALAESKQSYDGILAFDIHFENGKGEEVEPGKAVSVEFKAKKAGLKELDPDSFDADSVKVVHIGDKVEVVADTDDKSKVEGTVDVTATADEVKAIDASFEVDSFSTYTLIWEDESGNELKATIHWGTYEDGEFKDFDSTTTIDTTASSVDLNVNVADYYFVGVDYEGPDAEEPTHLEGVSVLKKADGQWKLGDAVVEPGSNIYVNYAEKGAGGYTPPPKPDPEVLAPETEKTVTDNGDGTYTIQLDIEGKQAEEVTQVGANVIVIMDITQSMTNNMPGGGTRMAAAKQALNTLITTLDPDTNLINFTAVNFGNSANYSNGVNWTTSTSAMQGYVTGLPNNPSDLGTCWQAGLQGGIDRVGTAPAGNETYVIFVTDGNPNGWVNAQGRYQQQGSGQFVQAAYNAAVDNANTLGTISHFYGVFCGDADGYTHLEDLITGANGDGVINGNSTSAIEEAFRNIAQTIVDNLGAGNTSVDDGVPTLSNISANVSAGDAGGFEYYITPKNGTMTEWEDAPGASYDKSNGVTWDLGEAGVLQDGYVYTLKFTVWPSQAAYDLIADLNNGLVDFDDLTEEQQASIDGSKETGYTLKTNTHLYTTFTDLEGTEYREENDARPSAMDLPTTTIKVAKYWNNEMDWLVNQGEDVTLTVTKDDEDYLDVVMGEPTQTGEHTWKQTPNKEIYISYGQIVGGEVKETGHEYTVVEPDSFSYHWDLTADVYRPMVIDGEPTMLIKTDSPTGTEGTDYYTIDGNTYQVAEAEENILTATNDRRSNLSIKKEVTGTGAPEDAVFAIQLTLDDVNGNHPGDDDYSDWYDTIWFAVQTDPTDRTTVVKEGVTVDGATPEDGNTGFYWFDNGGTATVYLKAGQYICITNIARDAEYTITELRGSDMPDGFTFVEATSAADNKAGETSTPAEISDNVAEGTIDQSNTDYSVVYKNKYEETSITVTKVWDDDSDALKVRPSTTDFAAKLTLLADGEEYEDAPDPVITDNEDDTFTIKYSGLPKYVAEEEVEYTVEEAAIDNYTTTGSPAANGETITNKISITEIEVEKKWANADGSTTWPSGVTVEIQLTADGEAVSGKTTTLSASKKSDKFESLPKYQDDGETEIEYGVDEVEVTGYETEVGDLTDGKITVTNTQVVTSVSAKKAWENADGTTTAPDGAKVTFTLYDDGEATDYTVTLKGEVGTEPKSTGGYESEAWTATFVNLPDDGSVYTVAETTPYTGYTASTEDPVADGETITNTQETTEVTVEKVWVNEDGSDTWPEGVTVSIQLTADGKAVDGKTAELTADQTSYTFENLPKYDGETEITYSVEEVEIEDYESEVGDITDGKITVTNTYVPYTPVTIDPPVKKVVEGSPDEEETYTFKLEALDESYPMPDAANGESSMTVEIEGEGEKEFGVITFTEPGTYKYEVTEVEGDNPDCEYDSSVYTVTAEVTKGADHKLEVKRTYEKDGESYDEAVFEFVNTYDEEEEEEEEPPEKPKKPDTGDYSNLAGFIGLLGVSSLGLVYMFFRRRREEK